MDPIVIKAIADFGLTGLVFYVWYTFNKSQTLERAEVEKRRTEERTEERKDWQEWLGGMHADMKSVIEVNTQVLARNSEVLGGVVASWMNCPASGTVDERGEPFRRRKVNGKSHEEET